MTLTFREKVAPIEALCRRVIERHGGQLGRAADHKGRQVGSTWRAGYWFPAPIDKASEAAHALDVLVWLVRAQTVTDRDLALNCAWEAAVLLHAAADKFPRLRQMRDLSAKGVAKRLEARDVDSSTSLAPRWAVAVSRRRPGVPKASVIETIATDYVRDQGEDDTDPAVVRRAASRIRKAIQRHGGTARSK